jgi:UDP-N-acetylglucosamine 4,6-dehydratase/5-epimerase
MFAPFLLLGIAIFRLPFAKSRAGFVASLACATGIVTFSLTCNVDIFETHWAYLSLSALAGSAVLFAWQADVPRHLIAIAGFLGNASYALYLVHPFFIPVTKALSDALALGTGARAGLYFALSLSVAHASFVCFERPAQRYARTDDAAARRRHGSLERRARRGARHRNRPMNQQLRPDAQFGSALPFAPDANILITGGTGSFGRVFTDMTLARFCPRRVVIYSRDEMKQWEMAKRYTGDKRLRFFIGDVRDRERLARALDGIDYVVHAAALKIVPTAEYNPFECVKTNIMGAMNVIDTCIDKGVKRVVALSTDKASSPVNRCGATKLVSDKLFVAGNAYVGGHDTRFAVVRYGNVMGSRGSVIPFFLSLADRRRLPITDPLMTRFMVTLKEGVELVWHAFADMEGGEVYVRKIPSMRITDVARAAEHHVIGIRPGEKVHEQMIGTEDALHTYEYDRYYKIVPAIAGEDNAVRVKGGRKVPAGFVYASDTNTEWMSVEALRSWIEANYRVSAET